MKDALKRLIGRDLDEIESFEITELHAWAEAPNDPNEKKRRNDEELDLLSQFVMEQPAGPEAPSQEYKMAIRRLVAMAASEPQLQLLEKIHVALEVEEKTTLPTFNNEQQVGSDLFSIKRYQLAGSASPQSNVL